MQVYKIQNYPDYELHYSDEVQLVYSKKREKYLELCKNYKGYYWFFKSDFEEYLTKFNNNLEEVIEHKKKHIYFLDML